MKHFFILSFPRSGSSLFRIMLNSHSRICVPPECGYIQWLSDKKIDGVYEFVNELKQCKKIETWGMDFDELTKFMLVKKPLTFFDMCECVQTFYSNRDIEMWGDKNNYYIHHYEQLKRLFPSAKFVHLIRDGRDVCLSYSKLKGFESKYAPKEKTIEEVALEWKEAIEGIPSDVFTVKYEDLIVDPSKTMKSVCSFLEIGYDESVLEYLEYNDEPKETLEWKQNTKTGIIKNNMNNYKKEFTPEQIETIEGIIKEPMINKGYSI